jgi:hypothetical protein
LVVTSLNAVIDYSLKVQRIFFQRTLSGKLQLKRAMQSIEELRENEQSKNSSINNNDAKKDNFQDENQIKPYLEIGIDRENYRKSKVNNSFWENSNIRIKNNEANELHINDLEIMGILTEDNKEICFPIKENKYIKNESELIYINGLVYTKKARTYFKYLNTEAPNTEKTIQDGSILELSNLNQILYRSYCISYKKDTKIYN